MNKRSKKLYYTVLLIFPALMLLFSLLLCGVDPSMAPAAAASLFLLVAIALLARWDLKRSQ